MKSKIIYFLKRILGIDRFERIDVLTSGFMYLTPKYVAEIEKISIDNALAKLDAAVKDGFMEKKYLFNSIDLSFPLLVEEKEIGTDVRVEDFPEIGETINVFVSSEATQEVYVAF